MPVMPTSSSDASLQRSLCFLKDDPDNAHLQAEVFERALQCGALDVATEHAHRALAARPDDAVWLNRMAMLDMAQQRYAHADTLLAGLQARGFADEAISFNRAYCASCLGNDEAACSTLKRLLAASALPGVFPLLMRCLHRLGRIDEALELFTDRLAAGFTVDDDAASFAIASLLAIDADRLPLAQRWADEALQHAPKQMEALVARASVALARQDADAAERDLCVALGINPNDGRACSAMGVVWLLRQDPEQACTYFQHAVTALPDHIGSWHGLGWCQLMLQDAIGAQHAFTHALERDHNFAESHGGLAMAFAILGQFDAAQACVARALRLDVRSLSGRYAQALINGEVGDLAAFKRRAKAILGDSAMTDGRNLAAIVLRSR